MGMIAAIVRSKLITRRWSEATKLLHPKLIGSWRGRMTTHPGQPYYVPLSINLSGCADPTGFQEIIDNGIQLVHAPPDP